MKCSLLRLRLLWRQECLGVELNFLNLSQIINIWRFFQFDQNGLTFLRHPINISQLYQPINTRGLMICKSLGLFLFKCSISIMQNSQAIKKAMQKLSYIFVLKIYGKIKSKLGINFLLIRTYIKSVQRHTNIFTITNYYYLIIFKF
ncbi:unnamed protein product [Paramecium octaurelia]|uniref:Uncharacterized protein n=1 Tax=Paramecium octaurelia TaxID=43137 RepID=A0A8S1U3X0_PAROT|nr:unnamed protein product [Paramecium octaurelia]